MKLEIQRFVGKPRIEQGAWFSKLTIPFDADVNPDEPDKWDTQSTY